MSDAEFVAEIQRHWKHWSEHLGLDNWWVDFKPTKSKDYVMELHPSQKGYLRAQVLVSNVGEDLIFNDIGKNVLHECLHLIFAWQDDYVRDTLGNQSFNTYMRMVEPNIDELTSCFLKMHATSGCEL